MDTKTTLIRLIVVSMPAFEEPSSNNPGAVLDYFSKTASNWNKAAEKAKELIENNPHDLETLVIPFTNLLGFLDRIGLNQSSLKVVLLEGVDKELSDKIKSKLWDRFRILVTDTQIEFVKNNVEDVYLLYCSQIAQITPPGPRHRTAASGRYEQIRDLMAENLDIAQIAQQMNLSVPSIYNLRTRFKARLLKDVGQEVKGMKFTKSHE